MQLNYYADELQQPHIYATAEPSMSGVGAVMDMTISALSILGPRAYSLGIPGYWYILPEGAIFDPEHIGNYSRFSEYQLTAQPFFMGIFLDAPPFVFENGAEGFGTNDRFGWAKLQPDSSLTNLTLSDSAMTFDGQGIIVGSETTVVPEPSAFVLLAIGAVGLMIRQRFT